LQRLEASLGGLDNFVTRVKEEFGERYGGKWADTVGSGPGIAIGLVNPTPADQERLRELSQSDRVRFFPVRYSEAQLQRWRDEIMAVLRRHGVAGGADTEGPRNRVWLTVNVWPDEVAAEVSRLGVPADALLIETGSTLGVNTSLLVNCVPRAGEVPKEPTANGCD